MARVVCDLRRCLPKSYSRVFLDANVLLYVHAPFPTPDDLRTKTYSAIFSNLVKSGSEVFVNTHVISEYVNRYLRIVHRAQDQEGREYTGFKDFRECSEFEDVAQSVADEVYHILQAVNISNVAFDGVQIQNILDDLGPSRKDFVDSIIAADCHALGATLLTHDRDFAKYEEIDIMTSNPRLVGLCED